MWVQMEAYPLAASAPRLPAIAIFSGLDSAVVERIRQSQGSLRAAGVKFGVHHETVRRIRAGIMHATAPGKPWIRLSDDTVEEMRIRHEEAGWSYRQIARFYSIPLGTVRTICAYRRR